MPDSHVPMKANKPALAFTAKEINGTVVAASLLSENRTLHVSGKITHGKKGDYVITDGAGTSFILPAEAAPLVLAAAPAGSEDEPGFDELFDNVYVV